MFDTLHDIKIWSIFDSNWPSAAINNDHKDRHVSFIDTVATNDVEPQTDNEDP